MQLVGKAALVTGTRRVGASVALALASRGADVAVAYHRSRQKAEELVAAIVAQGRRAVALHADLRSPHDCRTLVEETAGQLGQLDVLVHLASIYRDVPFASLTERDWDENLDVDARAALLCAHAAMPHMRAGGGGRIIMFSDWLARSGRPRYKGYLTYYVAKAAVTGLTEALALELAGDGILVNAIAPGPILAPDDLTDEEFQAVERSTPLGRWGGEEEIAKTVLALVESDFITGETIRVDGGRHIR